MSRHEVELILGRSAKIGVTENGLRRFCLKEDNLRKLHETRISTAEPRALTKVCKQEFSFEFSLVMWPAPP